MDFSKDISSSNETEKSDQALSKQGDFLDDRGFTVWPRHWSELFSRANQMAQTLSVGQQQRLALSRARSRRPEVLFLDEPTAALDPSVSDRIESLLKELAAEGTQIMMTTHNLAQAERLADMILFMVDGTIDAQQDKVTFFNEPGSQAARQFINRESMHSVIARGE